MTHNNDAQVIRRWSVLFAAGAALAPLCLVSCSSKPAAVEPPSISGSRASSLAMDQYDTNGDGVVAGDELQSAPGLNAALATMDTNKDGGISADEVAARIGVWKNSLIGVMSMSFTVTLNGRPLEGAQVTFEPEEFLGDEIKTANGETDYFGTGSASIPVEDRPDPSTPGGMHLGLYKVRISKLEDGRETIPDKYNENTILGQEVSPDVPAIMNRRVRYALKSE